MFFVAEVQNDFGSKTTAWDHESLEGKVACPMKRRRFKFLYGFRGVRVELEVYFELGVFVGWSEKLVEVSTQVLLKWWYLRNERSALIHGVDVIVLQLEAVFGDFGDEGAVAVNGIKVVAKLATCLAEWVFGDSAPEALSGFDFFVEDGGIGMVCGVMDLASDDGDLVEILGHEMVDAVSQFRWHAGQRRLRRWAA